MKPAPPASPLVDLPDDSRLWAGRAWTDFVTKTRESRRLAVLPICGFADWGLGRPLDLEETLGMAVLRHTLASRLLRHAPLAVLPPLRWTLGPYPHCAFGVDFETALEILSDLAASVKDAGFTKLAFFITSPWNEELADVAGRQARVRHGIQAYPITLARLGLDLHPGRNPDRSAVAAAACSCYGDLPRADDAAAGSSELAEFRPGCFRQPPPALPVRPLAGEITEGGKLLAEAGRRLSAILADAIGDLPPHR